MVCSVYSIQCTKKIEDDENELTCSLALSIFAPIPAMLKTMNERQTSHRRVNEPNDRLFQQHKE